MSRSCSIVMLGNESRPGNSKSPAGTSDIARLNPKRLSLNHLAERDRKYDTVTSFCAEEVSVTNTGRSGAELGSIALLELSMYRYRT